MAVFLFDQVTLSSEKKHTFHFHHWHHLVFVTGELVEHKFISLYQDRQLAKLIQTQLHSKENLNCHYCNFDYPYAVQSQPLN